MYFKRFVLFFEHCDCSLGNTNLRPFKVLALRVWKNEYYFFQKIGRLRAKFLAPNFLALNEL